MRMSAKHESVLEILLDTNNFSKMIQSKFGLIFLKVLEKLGRKQRNGFQTSDTAFILLPWF